MMIKNFNSLANTKVKKKALQILEVGLTAAEPKNFLKEFVSKNHISTGKKSYIFIELWENFCGCIWKGLRFYGRICIKEN